MEDSFAATFCEQSTAMVYVLTEIFGFMWGYVSSCSMERYKAFGIFLNEVKENRHKIYYLPPYWTRSQQWSKFKKCLHVLR